MAKKTAKKYEVSRSDIQEQLQQVADQLREIDTFESSPSDVLEQISDLVGELESLCDRVTDQA